MNTLQRAWIFQGWCKNAFKGGFLMWLLERVPLTLRRYLLRALPSPIAAKKERWQLQHSPLALFLTGFWNFEFFFWEKIPLFLGGVSACHMHTSTLLSTEPCYLEPVETLSVCICLCPSSPTTSQSFVMHVRWSIYSLHLHCVLGIWHWSNFSLPVLADTVRHRPVNSSNAI